MNLAGVPMLGINMLNQFATLLLMSGAGYLTVFSADQLHALGMLFFNLHEYGYSIAVISWGFYLLPLGYLIYKSGYFPRILGILVIIAGFGFLLNPFTNFLLPNYQATLIPILDTLKIGEILFIIWLVFRGAKIPKTEKVKG